MIQFILSPLEEEKAIAFQKKHYHPESFQEVAVPVSNIYYKITHCSIGQITKIVCSICEEDPMVNIEDQEEDITDSDSW